MTGKVKLGTTDADGRTAAWHACANGCARAMEVLRSRAPGKKWACRADNAGVTPLLACCAAGHTEATRFLVEVMGLAIDRGHLEAARASNSGEGSCSEVVAYLEEALP